MKDVLQQIRNKRIEKGYSQEYMASLLEIDRVSYGLIETGKRKLYVDRLSKICSILELDFNELFAKSSYDKLKQNNLSVVNEAQVPYHTPAREVDALKMQVLLLEQKIDTLTKTISDKEKIIELLEAQLNQNK